MTLKIYTYSLVILLIFVNTFSAFATERSFIYFSNDSISNVKSDTFRITFSKDSLDAEVHYKAQDSIIYDIPNKMVYLFGKSHIDYKDLQVDAANIEIDWKANEIIAYGILDSNKVWHDKAIFKDGEKQFTAERMRYNFKTKRGKVYEANTQEGEGYVLSEAVKINEKRELFSAQSRYTTCSNLDHPHFYFKSKKVKIVPDKLLVAGPTALYLGDVPTPLVLPFGIFPIKKGRHSGILLPQFRQTEQRGFGLENGGYYFAINDYVDVALRGDIFTQGSYKVNVASIYALRYKFNGGVQFNYSVNKFGEPQDSLLQRFSKTRDFQFQWNHSQDPKSNPFSTFSSNVNISTSKFFRNNQYVDAQRILNSTINSSINYYKRFPNKPYSLSIGATHSQNNLPNIGSVKRPNMRFSLPNMSFSVPTFFPLKRKNKIGSNAFYEKISISYNTNAQNQFEVFDSAIFKKGTIDSMRAGISHSIPIRGNFKVLNYINLNPSITYNEKWNFNRLKYNYNEDSARVLSRKQFGFFAFRELDYSVDANTRFFGMLNFKKGKLKALRHVVNTNAYYRYKPKYYEIKQIVYNPRTNTNDTYASFTKSLYNRYTSQEVNGLGFGINNVLEAKIRKKTDTLISDKKIRLIDGLSWGGFYNFSADSFKLTLQDISLRTLLFDKVNIICSSTFSPYAQDSSGRLRKDYLWDTNKKLVRFESARFNVSSSFRSKQKSDAQTQRNRDNLSVNDRLRLVNNNDYVDFTIPWDVNISYDLSIRKVKQFKDNKYKDSLAVTQSVGLSGNILLTSKWKIGFSSGFDFTSKKFTYTNFDIHRDLHCWEMRFNVVPFGAYKSYTFGINVKASILQDLKLNRRKDWQDN